uniref:Nuclear receptor domain-containing protein n=1 Tax=Acrobeloides nanus TaxID=290746 RepID=A0A914DWG9_9BILA
MGVLACRACSAFYKRTVQLKRTYQCLNGSKNCDLILRKEKGLPICRYCRMQRCKEIGMCVGE